MSYTLKPLTPLQKDIASESYEDLHRMVYKIVFLFHKRYGGDLDTILSEANRLFLIAHARHDPKRGKLSTCIYYAIYHGLKDIMRKEKKRLRGAKEISLEAIINGNGEEEQNEIEGLLHMQKTSKERIEEVIMNVGEDCKSIIHFILFPSYEFYVETSESEDKDFWKMCLEEHLHFDMKWNKERIERAFEELKRALA